MNDLIIVENGEAMLAPETLTKIVAFESTMKTLKEQEEELKERIKVEMEAKGIIKIEAEGLRITYVEATTRESLDIRTLKKELPDVYDQYCKISPVKASLRVKVD